MKDSSEILDYSTIPISALKIETRNKLSALLDAKKFLLTEEGLPRDWRGLADLTRYPAAQVPSLEANVKQTAQILYKWSENDIHVANMRKLQEFLQEIDRYDVLDDTLENFESDAKAYLMSTTASNPKVPYAASSHTDNESITRDDANRALNGIKRPQLYDAFVLYADEDIEFVDKLVKETESHGFKLCLKDRDLLGGISSEHAAIAKLVAERCHRLVIVLSPAFVQSNLNNFIVDLALTKGISEKKRKIIPCVYELCKIPPSLTGFFLLYYRPNAMYDFWEKLRASLLLSEDERFSLMEEVNHTLIPKIIISKSTEKNSLPVSPISRLDESSCDIDSMHISKKHASTLDLSPSLSESNLKSSKFEEKSQSNPIIFKKPKKKPWIITILQPSRTLKIKSTKKKDSKKNMVAQ